MPNSSREREIKIGRAKSKREENKEEGNLTYLKVKIVDKCFHHKVKKNNICNASKKCKQNITRMDSPKQIKWQNVKSCCWTPIQIPLPMKERQIKSAWWVNNIDSSMKESVNERGEIICGSTGKDIRVRKGKKRVNKRDT
jgi:hypothetical protein